MTLAPNSINILATGRSLGSMHANIRGVFPSSSVHCIDFLVSQTRQGKKMIKKKKSWKVSLFLHYRKKGPWYWQKLASFSFFSINWYLKASTFSVKNFHGFYVSSVDHFIEQLRLRSLLPRSIKLLTHQSVDDKELREERLGLWCEDFKEIYDIVPSLPHIRLFGFQASAISSAALYSSRNLNFFPFLI